MERMPQPGEIYQHFKGNLYRVVTLAQHSETGEELVVYQALYGDYRVYARPLPLFVGEVDHEKYPQVQAKYRFTLIPAGVPVLPREPQPGEKGASSGSAGESGNAGNEPTRQAKDERSRQSEEGSFRPPENERPRQPAEERTLQSANEPSRQSADEPPRQPAREPREEDEFQLDPRLLAFLDADTYEQKLEIFASLYGKADRSMLNTIAVSLDLELEDGTPEEQYDTLKNCLLTLERYECNRLR